MHNPVKKFVKAFFYNNSFLLKKNRILLESSPDFADNTKYVYDELLRRKMNYKYRIYWLTSGARSFPKARNVCFVRRGSIRGKMLRLTCKYIIDSNIYIKKMRSSQFRIFLGHGSPLKMAQSYLRESGEIDCTTVSSAFFVEPTLFLHGSPLEKQNVAVTGLARCDGLLNDVHPATPYSRFERIIIWMPTYRNHKSGAQSSTTNIRFPYGVPIINNENELSALNNKLSSSNSALIIWRHPAEDTSSIKPIDMSNILIFDQNTFSEKNIQLYDFLKDTDALITDYSSIYYDYLLLKKPIGLAIPDLDEYSSTYSFVNKNYKDVVKGKYITTFKELSAFIDDVVSGKNLFTREMGEALRRYQTYTDGKSSARIVDILVSEMEKTK